MNPNFNLYGPTQNNIGSGWNNNYSYTEYNPYNNPQPQNFNNGAAPPPIGFILPNYQDNNVSQFDSNSYPPDCNVQNIPIYNPIQTMNENPSNILDSRSTNKILNPTQSNPESLYQSNTGISTKSTNVFTHPPLHESTTQRSSVTPQSKPVVSKSDYQKGLDKLAELMNDDVELDPNKMENLRQKYQLNK